MTVAAKMQSRFRIMKAASLLRYVSMFLHERIFRQLWTKDRLYIWASRL